MRATNQRTRAAAVVVVVAMLLPAAALPAHAADAADFTASPSAVVGGSTNTFTYTFTSQQAALNAAISTLTVRIDKAFTQPQTADPAAPGHISLTNGTCHAGLALGVLASDATHWLVPVELQCGVGDSFTVTYKDAVAPATTDPPTTYPFSATLAGAGAVGSFAPTSTVLVDDLPEPPTLDSAVGGDAVVDLAWSAPATGSVTGYQVQRSLTANAGFADVGALLSPATLATTDTAVVNGVTYHYRVVTVNAVGQSAPSNELQATPEVAPGAATLDSATGGDAEVMLSWTAGSGTVTGYRVERAAALAGPYGAVATLGNVTAHTDTGRTNGTTYWYRIVAVNGTSAGPASNVLSATPQLPLPDAPLLTGATAGDAQVVLAWTAPTTGGAVATYRVERATHTGGVAGAFTPLQAGLTVPGHTDAAAVNGTTYSYRVVAVNATGDGASSNVLSATPQAPVNNNNNNNNGGGGGGGGANPLPTPPVTPPQVGRCVDLAPTSGFGDVPAGQAHQRSIDCIAWKGITVGTTPRTFTPAGVTTRAQMASFLVRTLRESGTTLPTAADRFDDDTRSLHQQAINKLAAVGIVTGIGDGRFDPNAPVRRDQMATMLANTYAYIRDEQLAPDGDRFGDDNGNVHEPNINAAAHLGLVLGRADGRYAPTQATRRDQMASFIARLLDLLNS